MGLRIEKVIPFPKDLTKELVNEILTLQEGDSAFIDYKDYSKTVITNCLSNCRQRFLAKGLQLKSQSQTSGRRIWVFKDNY